MLTLMQIVIISGLSGSGKSIASTCLRMPLTLRGQPAFAFVASTRRPTGAEVSNASRWRLTAAVVRASPRCRNSWKNSAPPDSNCTFFSSTPKARRCSSGYSETRRRHPLADASRTLTEAIAEERRRLSSLSGLGHHIDTSELKPTMRCVSGFANSLRLTPTRR